MDQEVGLVIKSSLMNNSVIDGEFTKERVKSLLSKYPDRKCKVHLVHGYLREDEMAALYTHPKIKAMVSLSHGEGFGLPLIEAAGYGLPIITTEWSGPNDFLSMPIIRKNGRKKNKFMAAKVDYVVKPIQKEAIWKGVLEKESMWAYALEGDAKAKFRDMVKNYDNYKKNAEQLAENIKNNWTTEQQNKKFVNAFSPYGSVTDDSVDKIFEELAKV